MIVKMSCCMASLLFGYNGERYPVPDERAAREHRGDEQLVRSSSCGVGSIPGVLNLAQRGWLNDDEHPCPKPVCTCVCVVDVHRKVAEIQSGEIDWRIRLIGRGPFFQQLHLHDR